MRHPPRRRSRSTDSLDKKLTLALWDNLVRAYSVHLQSDKEGTIEAQRAMVTVEDVKKLKVQVRECQRPI